MASKKNNLYCRIVYTREPQESYDLEFSTDGGKTYILCVSTKFVTCKEYPSAGNSYLHFGLIHELTSCIDYGYKYIGIVDRQDC